MHRSRRKLKNKEREEPKEFNIRDTRRWCKGVMGREHDYRWLPAAGYRRSHITDLVWTEEKRCTNCHKIAETRRSSYKFGFLVKLCREKQGVTQEELARRMGVTQPRIVEIEADTNAPSLTTVAKIAHALKVEYRLKFFGMPLKIDGYEETPDWQRTEGWISV
jgi:DNA-binding XRE family transcriptional regulator